MKNRQQLEQRFAEVSAEASEINTRAEANHRALTTVESTRITALLAEAENLHGQIAALLIEELGNAPRPRQTGPGKVGNVVAPEFKAFGEFVRTGRITNATTMTEGTSDDGGATVPALVSEQIRDIQADQGAIRKLATVMKVTQPVEVPIATTYPGAQYRVEGDARELQTVPVIKTASLPGGSLSSAISVSTYLANDSAWNMESYVATAMGKAFGVTEGESFINGAGSAGECKGILAYTLAATADGSRTWGQLEKLHSGSSGAGLTPDFLLALSVKLNPAYRKNAAFVMHPATYSTLIQTKASSSGNYLLDGASSATGLPSAWGLPVVLDVNVPVAGASSASVLCGDFRAGYCIQDVGPMFIQRDPYTSRGNIIIWGESRLYAGVVDSNAIKVGVLAA
ncbi:MAG: phage major capsid protein [Anaeromyxobacteraceae bacterium]